VLAGAVLALGLLLGCDRAKPEQIAKEEADPAAACADATTVAKVKEIIFQNAEKAAATKLAIPQLAEQSGFKIELAVLDDLNKDTKRITCSGHAQIDFPDGAVTALGGAQHATADIKYTVQPSADGSGRIYTAFGAQDLIDGIATADLSRWAARLERPNSDSSPAAVPASAPQTAAILPAPSVAVIIRDDSSLTAREQALQGLYQNALDRDVTGAVRREQEQALSERQACADKTCVQKWFVRREAALKAWDAG
jgi:hypothetical protein